MLSGKYCRSAYSLFGILQMPAVCNAYIHHPMFPPNRRIEDRIRDLCAKVTVATDGDLEPVLQELLQLLHTTVEHMRESATKLLIEGAPLPEPRRRANDNELVNPETEKLQRRRPALGIEKE